MAATKETTTKKAAPKKETKTTAKKAPDTVLYKGKEFFVVEKTEAAYKLTDGVIHFFAKAKDVEEN